MDFFSFDRFFLYLDRNYTEIENNSISLISNIIKEMKGDDSIKICIWPGVHNKIP